MGTGEALHIPRADPSAMSAYLPPQSSGLPYSAAVAGVSAPAAAGRPDAAYLPPPGSCMVCYNPSVDLLLEPCHHQFHAACIERWLSKDKVCPTCWTPIQAPRRLLTQQQQQQQYAAHMQQQQQQQQQQQDNGGYPMDSKTHVLDGNAAAGTPTAAASADAGGPQQSSNPPTAMRKGKWTAEESAYCDRLIEEFKKGNLPLAEGTTLRTFLSKLLNCDPMRISKKYTGDQCIGKIIFRRREDEVSKDDMENIRKDLAELEKTYLEREQYNQRRREKRLESELSRDKSRFAAARSIGYAAAAGNPAAMRPQVQQQQGGGYPPAAVQPMTKQEPRPVPGPQVQQPNYGAPGRAGAMPVQPPLHPPQQSNNVSSHLFNGDHSNVSMLGIAGAQTQAPNQGQDNKPPSSSGMDGNSGDAFPRVSSIDSFSCLFPRVASIENFQHATSSGFGGMNPSGSYASTETHNTMTSSGFDSQSVGLPKPLSIGEGLNAYFPRIQSLEQLSNLLQDHGPNSPRGAATDPSAQNTRDTMENANDNNKQLSNENSTPGGGVRRRLGETGIKEEQQREADVNPETESSSASNSSCSAVSTAMSVTTSSTTKRLSPSHNTSASSGSGNQIQIPKPLNKMPRSSSGIFPRVPSMDKIPRVPSLDKLPRVASLDKLPRIPSMDKLHGMGGGEQRIPRVPSSDKMARVPSSDMLSRFGSSDHLSSFPSFSNLSSLSTSASYDKLSSLGGFKSGFPRNSSIEDILSLVASSESTGLPSNGSTLQLSALAAVAGEESSHIANERKRRLENSQQDAPLTSDKKSKLSA